MKCQPLNSLRWPNYIFNSADNNICKLPCYTLPSTQNLPPFINYMHTLLCAVPPSFLNFSAWENLSLLWQTSARFCSEGTKPIKPLSVMFIHQLSRSDCSLISELVMADNPMSVTWRHELRSSSWRLIRTVENRNTNSSDRVLQPFNTRTFKGTLWFVPYIKKKKDKKSMIKHFQYSTYS